MKKSRKSRLLSLFLAVIMVVGMLPLSAMPASAEKETVQPLATPTNLRWDGYTLKWDAVEGATSYSCKLLFYSDKSCETTLIDNHTGITQPSYNFYSDIYWSAEDYGEGDFIVGIQAIGSGQNGSSTYAYAAKKFTLISPTLPETPTNIRWDGSRLQWDLNSDRKVQFFLNYIYIDANDDITSGFIYPTAQHSLIVAEAMDLAYRLSGEGAFMVRIQTIEGVYGEELGQYTYSPSVELPMVLTEFTVKNKTDLNSGGFMDPGKSLSDYNFGRVSVAGSVSDYSAGLYVANIRTTWKKDGKEVESPQSTKLLNGETYTATITLTAAGGIQFSNLCAIRFVGDPVGYRCPISEDNTVATITRTLTVKCMHSSVAGSYRHDDTYHWKTCSTCGIEVQREKHTIQANTPIDGYLCNYCDVCGYSSPIRPIPHAMIALIEQKPYEYGSSIPGNTLEKVYCDNNCGSLQSIEWYRSTDSSLGTRVYEGDLFEKGYNYYAKVTVQSDDPQMIFNSDTTAVWQYAENVYAEKVGGTTIGSDGYTITQTFKVPLRGTVDSIAITGVTAPVAGEAASFDYTIPANQGYKKTMDANVGSLTWFELSEPLTEAPTDDALMELYLEGIAIAHYAADGPLTFQADKYYLFLANIDAQDNFAFTDSTTATVNGEPAAFQNYGLEAGDANVVYYFGQPQITVTTGVTVSGTYKSSGTTTDSTTVALYRSGQTTPAYTETVTGNSGSYSISNVAAGEYTMKVSKKNHVTREYTVTVSGSGTVTQNVEIRLLGDVNGDGKITTMDYTKTNSHARGMILMTGYELKCADVVGNDGKVTTMDAVRINAHAKGTNQLW